MFKIAFGMNRFDLLLYCINWLLRNINLYGVISCQKVRELRTLYVFAFFVLFLWSFGHTVNNYFYLIKIILKQVYLIKDGSLTSTTTLLRMLIEEQLNWRQILTRKGCIYLVTIKTLYPPQKKKKRKRKGCPGYDTKLYLVFELWLVCCTTSLPLLHDPL